MADSSKKNSVDEQRARQQELIELKRQKEAFEADPENYKPQKEEAVYVQSKYSKLSNFWYYSKFAIGFILIVVIIMAIGISQCATKTKYDLTIVLYFKNYADSTMSENIATIAEQYCEDYNGDGKTEVLVVNCAIPDDNRLADADGSTRLLGQFQNKEAIVYIVDTGAYKDLESSFGDDFLCHDLQLPDLNGTAFKLNGTVFDAAFNAVSDGYTNNFDYYIMRRNVSGTAIADKDGVGKHVRNAEKLIKAIVADPYMKGEESTGSTPSDVESMPSCIESTASEQMVTEQ